MKKIFLAIVLIGCFVTSAFASHPDNPPIPSENLTEKCNEQLFNVNIVSVSNSTVELLVEVNDVVNEICEYFNGSWLDTGLKIYCTLGGDVYTCTTYKITKLACSISGAIKLYMEGDINNATKKVLTTGAEIWVMSKVGGKVKLSPSNMCPIN